MSARPLIFIADIGHKATLCNTHTHTHTHTQGRLFAWTVDFLLDSESLAGVSLSEHAFTCSYDWYNEHFWAGSVCKYL